MKIRIISTFLGHGRILQDFGTGLSILLSMLPEVEQIEVITWEKDSSENLDTPGKIILNPTFSPNSPLSIFKTIKGCLNGKTDLLIFNLMPTAYANSNFVNFLGLMMPFILRKIFHQRVIVLYHNSSYTNDFEKLGYSGAFNKFRALIIRSMERLLFNSVNILMLGHSYVMNIRKHIAKAKVSHLDLKFFQSVPTLYLNDLMEKRIVNMGINKTPKILMFGNWGPQKDPTPVLEALRKIRSSGIHFHLTVAGGINVHFSDFKARIEALFEEYKDEIDTRIEYVPESALYPLFSETDLLIINYTTPGGFSSVLSMGIFFNNYIISSPFKEYIEQASNYGRIKFCQPRDLEYEIREFLLNIHPTLEPRNFVISPVIHQMVHNLRATILEDFP